MIRQRRPGRSVALAAGLLLAALTTAADAGRTAAEARGEQLYAQCLGCHAIGYNRTGPKHCGLFGRRAGSLPDYDYSSAMRRAEWVWDAQSLDRFLRAPVQMVPGTAMTWAGISDARQRSDLIAYLQEATREGQNCE